MLAFWPPIPCISWWMQSSKCDYESWSHQYTRFEAFGIETVLAHTTADFFSKPAAGSLLGLAPALSSPPFMETMGALKYARNGIV